MNLEGCVALVTGANRGLGAAYATALLDRSAAKVYAAVRRPETVHDPRLVPIRLDLTDRASIVRAADQAGDVNLVINNAGIFTRTPTLGHEDGLRQELEVNYFGPVAVSRAFAQVLAANRRAHPIPDLVDIILQIGRELAQRLIIHTRGALVGRHLPVRLPHLLLGMTNGLSCDVGIALLASSQEPRAPG